MRIDGAVVGGYAAKVARAADELETAAGEVGSGATTAEAYGEVAAQLGVPESYAHASQALRGQLTAGVAALRSVAAALEQLTTGHAERDADAAERIERAGRIS
ncbi:hypothetical protein G3I59_00010 [Amycolatopsis rubida]|uniref:Excreted virulence factor EspC, type VII ESX diderm n=1 Tax=Amycolatopsis rubida TaxID=112413 RepID=A0ABX0BJ38_9PSEU|nr:MULTISPECIES: hypothetical protein [Amycolatopsis]NEC54027.1 hypothetical protein [Amycolatopsis rubida]